MLIDSSQAVTRSVIYSLFPTAPSSDTTNTIYLSITIMWVLRILHDSQEQPYHLREKGEDQTALVYCSEIVE